VLYVVAMAAVIVGGVGVLFFRNRFWETADGEYWHCLGVRSFLLEILQASMIQSRNPATRNTGH
jgi:hypothetical protein